MPVRIVPFTNHEVVAVRAFNARMRAGNARTDFLLPEEPQERSSPIDAAITWTQYVALEGTEARGGVIEMDQPGVLNGTIHRVINYQSPLSEGILNKKYGLVSMHLVRFIQHRSPYCFIVGMGSSQNPLPRLLKAAGWTVKPAPFFFRIHRTSRFFKEFNLFRRSRASAALAGLASITGLGGLAIGMLQGRRRTFHKTTIEPVGSWGTWADEIWELFRSDCSFAVLRDQRTLQELYPVSDYRILRFLVRRQEQPVGWSACFVTPMKAHKHFGNLRVGTILDCVARRGEMEATIALTDSALADQGADLVISNQSHKLWIRAVRHAGFLRGPSNYLLGLSKALVDQIAREPDGENRIHVTRGDGDGRIHL